MKQNRGIAPAIAGLLVITIVLASTTAYLGFLALQGGKTNNSGSNFVATNVPVAGSGVGAGSVQGIDPPNNSITVSGTGQVSYTPNEALLTVSVVTVATTAGDATSQNAATVSKVIKAMNSVGVVNSSIQTQGFYLYPNYANNYGSTTPPSITSFSVTNSLLVNLTSSSASELGLKSGQVIDAAVAAGANQVNLQFSASTSLLSSLTNQALKSAVASAASQAQVIASSLGVTISGVISVQEGGSSYYYPYYGGYPYATFSAATISSVTTPIMPGTQTIYASVTAVYSIS